MALRSKLKNMPQKLSGREVVAEVVMVESRRLRSPKLVSFDRMGETRSAQTWNCCEGREARAWERLKELKVSCSSNKHKIAGKADVKAFE